MFDTKTGSCEVAVDQANLPRELVSLRGQVLADLADARVQDEFEWLGRVIEVAQIERMRRLAELENRQVLARDGHLSAASWLAETSTSHRGRRAVRFVWRAHCKTCRKRGTPAPVPRAFWAPT